MPPRNTTTATPDAPAAPSVPTAGEFNPEVNNLLAFAQTLRDEKENLYERIEANRSILRGYVKQGLCNDEQAQAVAEFYPKPKKADAATNGADTTATA